jgi:hypothetical protein
MQSVMPVWALATPFRETSNIFVLCGIPGCSRKLQAKQREKQVLKIFEPISLVFPRAAGKGTQQV